MSADMVYQIAHLLRRFLNRLHEGHCLVHLPTITPSRVKVFLREVTEASNEVYVGICGVIRFDLMQIGIVL